MKNLRNEDKAQTMLNRWVAIQTEMISSTIHEKRPTDPNVCNNVQECNMWRNQVITEISKKVADIQNASLGETAIRDLNDEINKLFKEKSNWEDKIKKLGGADYKKLIPKNIEQEGEEVPNSGGYKYWGAAKNLPGIRELFINKPKEIVKKNFMDMYRGVDLEYYGLSHDYDINKVDGENDFMNEIENEEKNQESILFLEYLKKINEEKQKKLNNDKNEISEKGFGNKIDIEDL